MRVIEVEDARYYVNELFNRKFNADAPDTPRHFVLQYKSDHTDWISCGYVHYSPYQTYQMCGGLVIDERVFKSMPSEHREVVRQAGGMAEIVMRQSLAQFPEAEVIWGHVGNKMAEKVDLRVGFVHTEFTHLMAVWQKDFSAEEKQKLAAEIAKIGPF